MLVNDKSRFTQKIIRELYIICKQWQLDTYAQRGFIRHTGFPAKHRSANYYCFKSLRALKILNQSFPFNFNLLKGQESFTLKKEKRSGTPTTGKRLVDKHVRHKGRLIKNTHLHAFINNNVHLKISQLTLGLP